MTHRVNTASSVHLPIYRCCVTAAASRRRIISFPPPPFAWERYDGDYRSPRIQSVIFLSCSSVRKMRMVVGCKRDQLRQVSAVNSCGYGWGNLRRYPALEHERSALLFYGGLNCLNCRLRRDGVSYSLGQGCGKTRTAFPEEFMIRLCQING